MVIVAHLVSFIQAVPGGGSSVHCGAASAGIPVDGQGRRAVAGGWGQDARSR